MVPSSSYCSVRVTCTTVSSCSADYMDFFFVVVSFCFIVKRQLSCRNVKNVKSRVAGLPGVESAVRAVLHRQLLQNITSWSLPRKMF